MNVIRLFSFVAIFCFFCLTTNVVYGNEDKIDPDVEIDEEESAVRPDESITATTDNLESKEDDDPNRIQSSPEFLTNHVFIQPTKANELIAGKLTRLLVGVRNKGTQNFIVESVDGSLRYPQDYSYYIQNFTALRPGKVVEPGLESTFEYLFMPSETFNGRPMGLVILINYQNNEGKRFQNAIFNQTINFVEVDEGFDGETFFLYIFLGAIVVLSGFLGYQYLLSPRVKRVANKLNSQSVNAQITKGNFDIDWIPKHHLVHNRSPKKSHREKKSRQTNETNGTTNTGAASSENDE